MKKKPHHIGFAYALMSVLFLSAGMLYYFAPQGNMLSFCPFTRVVYPHYEMDSSLHVSRADFQDSQTGGIYIMPASVKILDHFYATYEQSFQIASPSASGSMPRVYTLKIPQDIRQIKCATEKKKLFIKMILPLILKNNEHILNQRARLLAIEYRQKQGFPLQNSDRSFLKSMACEYKVPSLCLMTLLRRVDIVPPSLALAQTLLESGWGTSCAALKKNSIFGHMESLTEVAAFSSIMESVYVYVRNLNRNPAYKEFQSLRYSMRQKGKPLCGLTLANGLIKYSELGKGYILKIQSLIKRYNLQQYDSVKFLSA